MHTAKKYFETLFHALNLQLFATLQQGNTTMKPEIHFDREIDFNAIGIKVLSSHVVSINFDMEQSTGGFQGSFMGLMYNDSLLEGFSAYSKEACHESVHGKDTCGFFLARDLQCKGKS